MIKKIIRNYTHRLLMPRGRNYISDHQLETGWTKIKEAYKNKQICILYKKTDIKSKGTIILAHPYLADAKLFFLRRGHAEMYLKLGFDVFLFDFNGFGESPFLNFEYEEDLTQISLFPVMVFHLGPHILWPMPLLRTMYLTISSLRTVWTAIFRIIKKEIKGCIF